MMKIFKVTLLLALFAVAACELSPEEEDKVFDDFLVRLPKF